MHRHYTQSPVWRSRTEESECRRLDTSDLRLATWSKSLLCVRRSDGEARLAACNRPTTHRWGGRSPPHVTDKPYVRTCRKGIRRNLRTRDYSYLPRPFVLRHLAQDLPSPRAAVELTVCGRSAT